MGKVGCSEPKACRKRYALAFCFWGLALRLGGFLGGLLAPLMIVAIKVMRLSLCLRHL